MTENKKNWIIGLLIAIALTSFIRRDELLRVAEKLIFTSPYEREDLTIVTNTDASDLSPYSVNLNNTLRTANIYEGLLAFDANLKIVPSLAVSWGNINPTTWELKLRKEVLFHDRTPFTATSVVESFEKSTSLQGDPLKTYLGTISEIKVIDDHTIQILTETPDPLLLSKLTQFFIHRPENVGTGPYKTKEWTKGDNITLTAFDEYWGKDPDFKNVHFQVSSSKSQRQRLFEQGQIDLLAAVTPEQALELPKDQLKRSFSLEVNFLMMNTGDETLSDKKVREAIQARMNPEKIEEIGNNFVRSTSQLVAPGVYGYNAEIAPYTYDSNAAQTNLFGKQLKKLSIDTLETYRTLSQYLEEELKELGFSVQINILSPQELLTKIQNNESQAFLVGWQAENGDAGGLLDAFIHSEGEFNHGRFSSSEIDQLIEQSRSEMSPPKRLANLQDIIKRVSDELIAIPLFESSRLYALKEDIKWEPRLDGLIKAVDVSLK